MKKAIMLFFAILMLTACTKESKDEVPKPKDEVIHNNYSFYGESENWEAEYYYNGTEIWSGNDGTKTYSNKDHFEFKIKYKGSLDDLSSIKKLEYSYETANSNGGASHDFDNPPKTLTFTTKGNSENGAKVNKDEVVKVNVHWGQYEESFELHSKKK